MNRNAYLIQGTNVAGNLDIERGRTIYPGGPSLNGSEQEQWLDDYSDIELVGSSANLNGQLWPMYPTGGGDRIGVDGDVLHPGYEFDTDEATCENPHSANLERPCSGRGYEPPTYRR